MLTLLPFSTAYALTPLLDNDASSLASQFAREELNPCDTNNRKTRCDFVGVMRQSISQVQQAFQKAMVHYPDLAGKISLKITIAPDGVVQSASIVKSTVNNSDLESDILSIVKALKFKAANIDTFEGKYDFNFVSN